MIYKIAAVYIVLINIMAFIVYGIDKAKAKQNKWRIPEKVLIIFAILCGSIGAILGMIVFHHKTRKPKFYVGVPIIIVLQIALTVLYFYTTH
ncbi:MAG: DUF1294 domain-containing protein [Clostridia bacterium]|nr:DUF1294 domain-containing protein [Clostridia bacterium]MBQ2152165.1 DUF1294 domain-containing protein [Clostridia bacterium]